MCVEAEDDLQESVLSSSQVKPRAALGPGRSTFRPDVYGTLPSINELASTPNSLLIVSAAFGS